MGAQTSQLSAPIGSTVTMTMAQEKRPLSATNQTTLIVATQQQSENERRLRHEAIVPAMDAETIIDHIGYNERPFGQWLLGKWQQTPGQTNNLINITFGQWLRLVFLIIPIPGDRCFEITTPMKSLKKCHSPALEYCIK